MHPTHYPFTVGKRPDLLGVALLKNVNLRLHSMETVHELDSDHRPIILELAGAGPFDQQHPCHPNDHRQEGK